MMARVKALLRRWLGVPSAEELQAVPLKLMEVRMLEHLRARELHLAETIRDGHHGAIPLHQMITAELRELQLRFGERTDDTWA